MNARLINSIIAAAVISSVAPQQSMCAGDTAWSASVVDGRFGAALNGEWSGAESLKGLPAYKGFPITVEFWCKIEPRPLLYNFVWCNNVLVADEPRESAEHWEIYLEGADGKTPYGSVSAYLPGMYPETIRSSKSVADGQWHYLAMTIDGRSIALYIDGERVVNTPVTRKPSGTVIPGVLSVAECKLSTGGTLDFNGAIDEVRLSNIVRDIRGIPTAPLKADAQTIGLWHFDHVDADGEFPDSSSNANPLRVSAAESLDEIERTSFKAGPSPLASNARTISLEPGAIETPAENSCYSLDGPWQLVEGDTAVWDKPITAVVPGGVHSALYLAGLIPSPYLGRNQDIAAKWSNKTYWYKKQFSRPPAGQDEELVFYGVCNRATFWLNGKELGKHEGMFTRIEFPIHDWLKDTNTLVVKLDPAIDWTKTVVFNNAYYYGAKIPPLGIWRSVEIHGEPTVRVHEQFIATRDAEAGRMDLMATITGPATGWTGKLIGVISPENFKGQSAHFEYGVSSATADRKIHLQFSICDPQLWWPVDMGRPNLYRLKLAYLPAAGGSPDVQQTTFAIRTIQMAPVNGKSQPRLYNWTFVVNGKPIFVKGANWFTCDAMMDFSRARYNRCLTQAANQHIQMLRCWGCGLVETNEFYDLCDRKGIMVMQEWPTTWNSADTQPFELLKETVRENTLRLRNHPSLAIYVGGNESSYYSSIATIFGPAINMMGRLSMELDGTRPFHRAEPRGGADHDYSVFHYGRPIDFAFTAQAIFLGEFGIASYPNYESVQRFLPNDERTLWPPPPDKSFAYHTPTGFAGEGETLAYMTKALQFFTRRETMRDFIIDSQLTQSLLVRHMVERARSSWPESTCALYFIFNDSTPAASFSTVDWYGVPKISYYLIQDSYAPLLAIAQFPKATTQNEPLALPIYLLDDANALKDCTWEVAVRAYGADLKLIKEVKFLGGGSINDVEKLGDFTLTAEETKTAPMLTVTDVIKDGVLARRNYYFTNFQAVKGCLFDLPKTKLRQRVDNGQVVVKNVGTLPAVGVNVSCPGHSDAFFAEENYFWLEPGEERGVAVNSTEGVLVSAWNAASAGK